MRKASVWLDSEDKPHENLELCRQAELEIIFRVSEPEDPWHLGPDAAKAAAQIVLLNQARVIAVLTTTKRSHPGARKAFGAKRKRKDNPKQPELPYPPSAAPSVDSQNGTSHVKDNEISSATTIHEAPF